MSKSEEPILTHFSAVTDVELPNHYYAELGKALYRWSQLEITINSVAASIAHPEWLKGIEELRGNLGFSVRRNIRLIRETAINRNAACETLRILDDAEKIYEDRNFIFHSTWGIASGKHAIAVAIQEWSGTSYDNFRPVALEEIVDFTSRCKQSSKLLFEIFLPLFHGSSSIEVNDDDGLTVGTNE